MDDSHLLIVEGSVIAANALKGQLASQGYSAVSLAASGEEALRFIQTSRVDLALIGAEMADSWDGNATSERIQTIQNLPVIYLAAVADDRLFERVLKSGAYNYIIKPVRGRELQIKIEMALNRHRLELSFKQAFESLLLFKRATEHSPVSVVITNTEGRIEYVNPKFIEITGYSQQEVIGQNPRVLKSGIQPDELYAGLWRTITTGNSWRGEFCNRRKHGQLYWERANISPIKNTEGRTTHFVAVKEDISESKQTADALAFLANSGGIHPTMDFFSSLALYLSKHLGMEYVGICRLEPGYMSAITKVFLMHGKFYEAQALILTNTLLEQVMSAGSYCISAGVRKMHPQDPIFQAREVEGFLGVVLWNYMHQPVGLLFVMGQQPLADTHLALSLLKLVAVRAASELERSQSAEALHKAHEEMKIRTAELESFNQAMVDREQRIIEMKEEVNALCAQMGRPPEYPETWKNQVSVEVLTSPGKAYHLMNPGLHL